MRKIICTLCLMVCCVFSAHSEELFIIVYKGDVRFVNPDYPALEHGFRYAVPKNAGLDYDQHSRFVLFTKTKFYEKKDPGQNTMNYDTMFKNVKNNMVQGFAHFMNNFHKLTELEYQSAGATPAGTRGLNKKNKAALTEDENHSPEDSARIVPKNVKLQWDLKKSIPNARLMVVNSQTRDTVYNSPATPNGTLDLVIEKPGGYDWFLYSSMEKKKRINRTFFQLSAAEAQKERDALAAFKKDIAALSKEMQDLLLEDYMLMHQLILN
ncbi:hypothetical protein [Flavobacterium sp.]|uniref:hypothetical protein n=1 Tax=Flavobacterium sp. TaxID=239 RepID=UPI0039E590BA